MHIFDLFEQRELPLFEKRRNADVNRKADLIDALKKYQGQRNVFVTFTADVGAQSHKTAPESRGIRARGPDHNTSGSKFGINPKSSFDTPLGIYAYPLEYVLFVNGQVPFAKAQPYVYVFQANGHYLDLDSYTESDLKKDVSRILDEAPGVTSAFDLNKARKNALVQNPGGILWNITRVASQFATALMYTNAGKTPPKISYGDSDKPIKPNFDEKTMTAKVQVIQWANLLKRLGYDGAIDTGLGIIHENEPTQAVFFDTKQLKVLEVVHNIRPVAAQNQFDIWNNKPKIFYNMLRDGKIKPDILIEYMKMYPTIFTFIAGPVNWSMFPPEAQAWIKENIVMLVDEVSRRRSSPNAFMRWVPLNDDEVIKIISRIPDELPYLSSKYFTPTVMKYIEDNIDMFRRSVVQMLHLPDELMIKALSTGGSYADLYLQSIKPNNLPSPGVTKWLLSHDYTATMSALVRMIPDLPTDFVVMMFQHLQKGYPEQFLWKLMSFEAVSEMEACLKTMSAPQVKKMIERVVVSQDFTGARHNQFVKFVQRIRPDALAGMGQDNIPY